MLEDFRNHDPAPTHEERAWIAANPFAAAARVAALIVVSVAVGGYGSVWLDGKGPAPSVARAGK
jgi:hypothetical protein